VQWLKDHVVQFPFISDIPQIKEIQKNHNDHQKQLDGFRVKVGALQDKAIGKLHESINTKFSLFMKQ
jgi:hypothetical protein